MRVIKVNRGGSDNIHAQVRFDNGWVDVDKDKKDNPAVVTIHQDKPLDLAQTRQLSFALGHAIDLAKDFDNLGTRLSLISRAL